MASVLTSSAVDHWFEPSGNQDDVSEWSNMSLRTCFSEQALVLCNRLETGTDYLLLSVDVNQPTYLLQSV